MLRQTLISTYTVPHAFWFLKCVIFVLKFWANQYNNKWFKCKEKYLFHIPQRNSFKYSVRDLIFRLGLQKILEEKVEHRTNCILLEKALPRNHLSYQTVLGKNSSLAWNFLAFLMFFRGESLLTILSEISLVILMLPT